MTEACFCDYPVDLRRARRVFAKAAAQLKRAEEKHGEWLRARRDEALDYYMAEFPGAYTPWTSDYGSLIDQSQQFSKLHDLAARVTELRLTRNEIRDMARAEREDFEVNWNARVERLSKTPIPKPAHKRAYAGPIEIALPKRKWWHL